MAEPHGHEEKMTGGEEERKEIADRIIDEIEDQEEERRDNDTDGVPTDEIFLKELNLVMILSFLSSLSNNEESLDEEGMQAEIVDHPKFSKHRRRHVNEFKGFERKRHLVQPKVKDCRHFRKM